MFSRFKRKKEDPRVELEDLLGKYEVPSISGTVIRLLGLLRDPDIPIAQVASQVELDPGLTVRILRLVNSAAFGLSSQVSNLQHAISLLGRSRLESLVLALAAAEQVPEEMGCLERRRFWEAAALRATLARAFAQHLHAATEAESFTAGLLQDMAVPLLASSSPVEYGELLERWHEDPELRLDSLERELLGYDHAAVGSLMAEDWGLPEYLVRAIAGHHGTNGNPEVDPAVQLVSLVTYAPERDCRNAVSTAAHRRFGIEMGVAEEIMDRSLSEAKDVAGMFLD